MKVKNFILTFLLLFCISSSWAQYNPEIYSGTIVKNDTLTVELKSSIQPIIISYPENFNNLIGFQLVAPKTYSISYVPLQDYIGLDKFIIETYDPDALFPGWGKPEYSTVEVEIVPSIITNDCHVVDLQTGIDSIAIDITSKNTSTAGGTIDLFEIANTQNAESFVIDSVFLSAKLNALSELAIVQYLVRDSLGTSNLSKVFIRPDGYEVSDTLELFIKPAQTLDLVLNKEPFTFSPPANGSLTNVTTGAYSYVAAKGNYTDTIYFNTQTATKFVTIRCIDRNTDTRFAKDDFVFTEKNNHVTFDVFANDLKDGYYITNHSPELQYDTLGLFTYYPDPWFIGEKEFFYTVYNGFEHQEASITIKVDNYLPRTEHSYDFTAFKEDNYLLDYNVPIDDYLFFVETAPSNGSVIIHGTTDTISTTCQTITGPSLLEYVPNPGFTGQDYFELEYCSITGSCTIVKVDMNVVDNPDPSYCHCIGGDCVWEGDLNNDGIVNHEDLLPLGFYLGLEGNVRSDFAYSVPRGQIADDWNYLFGTESYDIKHIDANGDGVITSHDANTILDNYGKINNLISDEWVGQSKIGLSFIPRSTDIDSGDLVIIDIAIGTENLPVVDMQGLSLDLNINSDIIDSASLEVIYHQNSWFTYNSPIIDITQQPSDGHVQTAFTRTDPSLAVGEGIIATLQFIGEDDLDGFKLLEDTKSIPFAVTARNIKMMSNAGREVRLQDASVILNMNISNDDPAPSIIEETIYPNPVRDNLFIANIDYDQALNTTVELLDLSGAVIGRYNLDKVSASGIDVRSLSTGIFLARFVRNDQVSIHKFVKF